MRAVWRNIYRMHTRKTGVYVHTKEKNYYTRVRYVEKSFHRKIISLGMSESQCIATVALRLQTSKKNTKDYFRGEIVNKKKLVQYISTLCVIFH